jgi:AraC-like DNA-binding protein
MENSNIHLVKAAFHAQFKSAMENCGVSADYYFKKVNLPTEVSDPESLLPVKPFYHLVNIVAIDEHIPDFGSRVAQLTPWHRVLSLGPLIQASTDLKQLLEKFCQIASSQSSSVLFTFVDEGSNFSFCYSNSLFYKGDIQMELYRITSMIQLVQLATGIQWRPETVRLEMPKIEIAKACPLLTNSEITYLQPDSAVFIQPDLLQLPVHLEIPLSLKTDNNIQADLYIKFDDAIDQIIKTYSITKNTSIEEIAGIADTSVRTLQRRLKDKGLKFNDLLNRAKFIHAKQQLRDTQLSIKAISESLGYSDSAHFSRAFLRWSGFSPSKFRKGLSRIS